MSYAIFKPVYGIPLANKKGSEVSDEIQSLLSNESAGFITEYGSDTSIAFGVYIGKEFNECCNHVEISDLVLTVKQNHIDEFNKLYENLSNEVKSEMKKFGKPRIFYLCSRS